VIAPGDRALGALTALGDTAPDGSTLLAWQRADRTLLVEAI
jgi:hypothetical protein